MAEEQVLIVDMRLKDNLTGPLAAAKQSVAGVGDSAAASASKLEGAFANAANGIRAKFATLGTDIQKGIGLGLGIGTVQLVSQATTAVKDFFEESIKGAIEEEAGIKRLGQTLRENVADFDGNTDAIEANILAREKLGFSDNDLRDSLGALSAATGSVAEAFRLQSIAQDLARFKGESLAQATDELVKVQAGSFRSLKSLGIQLDATATSEEALAAIQRVVAGQALAFGDTAAGAMARAGVAVDELKDKVGKGLLPVLGQAADALSDVLDSPAVTAAGEGIGASFGGWGASISGALNFGEALKFVLNVQNDAVHSFQAISIAQSDTTASYIAQERALTDTRAALTGLTPAVMEATAAFLAHERVLSAVDYNYGLLGHSIDGVKTGLGGYTVTLLGATGQTDKLSDAILRGGNDAITGASGYSLLADQIDRLRGQASQPFVANVKIGDDNIPSGTGKTGAQVFLDDQDTARRNREERERKAAEDLAKRLADAKAAASEYADVLANKLDTALRRERDTAKSLFDTLHERHLQAINDTEKLAEKRHDATTQAISDALKLQLATNAAPADAAEARQRQIELSRQRRDLGEALQTAQQGGDPLAIRNASEALQSFNASQRINSLRETQAKLDAAAQEQARVQTKDADDKLAAAKLAQAAAIKIETDRNKKLVDAFDREIAAIRVRDKGASPAKFMKDISDAERKFGITRDAQGHSHIEDPLVSAIKTVKIPPPIFSPTIVYQPPVFAINGRLLASYIVSAQSPTATPGVRTGTLAPKAAG